MDGGFSIGITRRNSKYGAADPLILLGKIQRSFRKIWQSAGGLHSLPLQSTNLDLMKILLTGATGALGSAVLDQLRQTWYPSEIAVLSRNPEKRDALAAEGFRAHLGDYDDPAGLRRAMVDVPTVLLIAAGDQGNRLQQHSNVIEAAVASGVRCVAYTSRSLRDRATLENTLMEEHFATEDYLKRSGLNYTIFRNALYMDVIPIFAGPRVFEVGIRQPAGEGRVAYALRRELGEAMANVLVREACSNRTYHFSGERSASFHEIAAVLTELSGREVRYEPLAADAFTDLMLANGMPAPGVKKIIAFNGDIRNGQEAQTSDELARWLGRSPTPLRQGLQELFDL